MTSDPALERTIDKILNHTKDEILSGLKTSLEESHGTLDDSLPRLEHEYEKMISDGRKEADKLEKQLVGSSDLEARNRQLVLVEESVERVFADAIKKIRNAKRDAAYAGMISGMLDEATKVLRTPQIMVFTSTQDNGIVKKLLSKSTDAELAPDSIECMGGIIVKSKDGIMTFDSTVDAKLERMKPLIRKKIATKFGIGS